MKLGFRFTWSSRHEERVFLSHLSLLINHRGMCVCVCVCVYICMDEVFYCLYSLVSISAALRLHTSFAAVEANWMWRLPTTGGWTVSFRDHRPWNRLRLWYLGRYVKEQ